MWSVWIYDVLIKIKYLLYWILSDYSNNDIKSNEGQHKWLLCPKQFLVCQNLHFFFFAWTCIYSDVYDPFFQSLDAALFLQNIILIWGWNQQLADQFCYQNNFACLLCTFVGYFQLDLVGDTIVNTDWGDFHHGPKDLVGIVQMNIAAISIEYECFFMFERDPKDKRVQENLINWLIDSIK